MSELPEGLSCPECNYPVEGATGLQKNQTVTDGAVSLCLNCGFAGIFDVSALGAISIRRPTHEEYREIVKIKMVQRAQSVISARGRFWPRKP